MSLNITAVRLTAHTGSWTKTGRRYSRTYQVEYEGGAFTPYAIVAATYAVGLTPIPKPGAIDPDDALCQVEQWGTIKQARIDPRDANKGTAEVEVSSATPERNYSPAVNPWDRPAEISGGGATVEEVFQIDVDGTPLTNSAGDLIDPLFEQPVNTASFTITRFEENNPANRAATYSNTTNVGTWHGVAVDKALMGEITWSEVREIVNGVAKGFYRVTYPITVRQGGWKLKVIDNGYVLKVSGVRRSKTDDLGNPTYTPVLLNGSGGELASGADPVYFPAEGFRRYNQANWTTLGLPDPFANATP